MHRTAVLTSTMTGLAALVGAAGTKTDTSWYRTLEKLRVDLAPQPVTPTRGCHRGPVVPTQRYRCSGRPADPYCGRTCARP